MTHLDEARSEGHGDEPDGEQLDDLALAELARRRDATAFVRLMTRHRKLIYAAVYSAAGPTPHADDIAQDVAVAAWRGIHRVREAAAVPSWLWVIATRCAQRSRDRHGPTDPLGLDDTAEAHHATQDDTGRVLDRILIDAALAQLPEHERMIVVMHLVSDLSYRQIAEYTGLPIGTVQSRYGRGIRRLRTLLAQNPPAPDHDHAHAPGSTTPPPPRSPHGGPA
ncbi:MAG TPA: RNA polymerase sigma factor [Streptomyces sp.]